MTKKKRHLPWVRPTIKRLMNKRDRLHKKAKRSGKVQHKGAYRQLRKRITNSLRDSHAKYVEEVMGGIAPSPDGSTSAGIKRAWSYTELLRSESMGIPALFWNNRLCANDVSKVETLREQYESVFTRGEKVRNAVAVCLRTFFFSLNPVRSRSFMDNN